MVSLNRAKKSILTMHIFPYAWVVETLNSTKIHVSLGITKLEKQRREIPSGLMSTFLQI